MSRAVDRYRWRLQERRCVIEAGVIGLGFMGGVHIAAYRAAAAAGFPCRLAAVCDADPARLTGELPASIEPAQSSISDRLFDLKSVRTFTEVDQLLAEPALQLVSICTYTETHADLASRALKAGKHVIVEKPVALEASDIRRLADTARQCGRLCLPAMCMRFWPEWEWLRARIFDESFGRVRSAVFQRIGSGPSWGRTFYDDSQRSGGMIVDLHIHDADFIYWCFGRPRTVTTTGGPNHLTTAYRFEDGPPHVTAEGAWDLAPAAGFRMKYLVAFERATAEFDSTRATPLVVHGKDASEPMKFDNVNGYDGEIRHMLSAIGSKDVDLRATLDDAVVVTEILKAECASLERGQPIALA